MKMEKKKKKGKQEKNQKTPKKNDKKNDTLIDKEKCSKENQTNKGNKVKKVKSQKKLGNVQSVEDIKPIKEKDEDEKNSPEHMIEEKDNKINKNNNKKKSKNKNKKEKIETCQGENMKVQTNKTQENNNIIITENITNNNIQITDTYQPNNILIKIDDSTKEKNNKDTFVKNNSSVNSSSKNVNHSTDTIQDNIYIELKKEKEIEINHNNVNTSLTFPSNRNKNIIHLQVTEINSEQTIGDNKNGIKKRKCVEKKIEKVFKKTNDTNNNNNNNNNMQISTCNKNDIAEDVININNITNQNIKQNIIKKGNKTHDPIKTKQTKIILTDNDAKDKILKYMKKANRPYSVINVYDNLHGCINKNNVQRFMDELSKENKLQCKEYGKAKVYLINQKEFKSLNTNEMNKLKMDMELVQEQNELFKIDFNNLVKKKKKLLQDLELIQNLEEYKKKIQNIEDEIKSYEQMNKNSKFTIEEIEHIKKNHGYLHFMWLKRKTLCIEIIKCIATLTEKDTKGVIYHLGIDVDEDVIPPNLYS
ncbi:hypothetical protein PFTANZ_03696 [Plasmodium falciparum Tanzania (2000708)]|uniref:Homologous-pairing protein 2 winged helix domain-containing protein n=1 Tax=Plasmodium falciparum Tanzania (2000708) TaxID=1036725 RepID=A0A024W5Y8_PLAFA|nr:hypothetical protein PFTANZ_03696 [Plasmodium falciparum Tanzania (2000708)]